MSKALESALEAVRRMSPGSEIDPMLWHEMLEELHIDNADSNQPNTGPRWIYILRK